MIRTWRFDLAADLAADLTAKIGKVGLPADVVQVGEWPCQRTVENVLDWFVTNRRFSRPLGGVRGQLSLHRAREVS